MREVSPVEDDWAGVVRFTAPAPPAVTLAALSRCVRLLALAGVERPARRELVEVGWAEGLRLGAVG